MEAMDIQAVESKLSDVTVTAIPMSGKNVHKDLGHGGSSHATISTVPAASPSSIGKDKDNGTSKYAQLLAVIEEMGKEVRPSYSDDCLCHSYNALIGVKEGEKDARNIRTSMSMVPGLMTVAFLNISVYTKFWDYVKQIPSSIEP